MKKILLIIILMLTANNLKAMEIPFTIENLKSYAQELYHQDYNKMWELYGRLYKKAMSCKDMKSTADFLQVSRNNGWPSEFEEGYAEDMEKFLSMNPACFLDAFKILDDNDRILVANRFKSTVMLEETELRKNLPNLQDSKTYQPIISDLLRLIAGVEEKNAQAVTQVNFDIIASSTFSHKKDRYNIKNLLVFDYSRSWCEGVNGNGLNESIWFYYPSRRILYNASYLEISVLNGFGVSDKLYHANSRPSLIEIIIIEPYSWDFNVLKTETIKLKDTKLAQTFKVKMPDQIPKVLKIQLKIKEVYKGSIYQDTCISGIRINMVH